MLMQFIATCGRQIATELADPESQGFGRKESDVKQS